MIFSPLPHPHLLPSLTTSFSQKEACVPVIQSNLVFLWRCVLYSPTFLWHKCYFVASPWILTHGRPMRQGSLQQSPVQRRMLHSPVAHGTTNISPVLSLLVRAPVSWSSVRSSRTETTSNSIQHRTVCSAPCFVDAQHRGTLQEGLFQTWAHVKMQRSFPNQWRQFKLIVWILT